MISILKEKFSSCLRYLKANIRVILIGFVVLINSGICFISFAGTMKLKAIIYLCSLAVLIVLLICQKDYTYFLENIKAKKFKAVFKRFFSLFLTPDLFALTFIFLISFLNIALNLSSGFSNINSVLGNLLMLLYGYLIAQIVDYKTFLRILTKSVFFVSVFAIIFFLTIQTLHFSFGTSSFWSTAYSYDSYLGIFYSYTSMNHLSRVGRLMSVFWEPGLYANILIICIVYELFYSEVTSVTRTIVFILCLYLTKSTAGYLLVAVVFAAYIISKLKSKTREITFGVVLLFALLGIIFSSQIFNLLATILPSVFGKLVIENSSFITRFKSPLQFFAIFAESPLFGKGFDVAYLTYKNNTQNTAIDSATSTIGYFAASLGIFGILFFILVSCGILCLGRNKNNIYSRIILLIVFLLMFNTEVQSEILIFTSFFFISIKELSKYRLTEKTCISPNSLLVKMSSDSDNASFYKNVLGSSILKIATIIVGFFSVPVLNSFFGGDAEYGVWLSVVAIITTVLSLDFGITDGLKTKLVDSIVKKDYERSKKLIASSYCLLLIISISIITLFSLLFVIIDSRAFFDKNSVVSSSTLYISLFLIILTIGIEIVLRNVVPILSSCGRIVLASSISFIPNVLIFLFALIFNGVFDNPMIALAIIYLISIVTPFVVATIYTFKVAAPHLVPDFKKIEKAYFKEITVVGFQFLMIQICNIVLFGMDRTIVGWIFAESNVLYEKYFKIFSTIVSLFMVVQPTLWFYIAKFRSENNKVLTKKYMLYSIITSGVLALGSVFAGLIFQLLVDLWLGDQTFTVVIGDLVPFILYGVIYSLFAALCLICYSTKTLKSMAIGALIVTVLKIVSVIIVKINETSLQWSVIMWIDVGLLVVYILVSSISVIIKKMKGELYVEKAS